MSYELDIRGAAAERIYPLGEAFHGKNPEGTELAFNNYYMEKDGQPFFSVSGEFHFSRMNCIRWEDELIKMKMAGLNIVATYIFWIHHEEEEGKFDFTGSKDLRRFVQLCQKHGLYVILRVGPFAHGEVRNGGLPDWLYGKPFEVRKVSPGFMDCVRKLYTQIHAQVEGMYYKDGGPVIGVQVDNEYMHSSAPWEVTTGISNEWAFGGDEGEEYLLALRDLARDCGMAPAFFTCTGWGGAPVPEEMLPLWGGYAFRPWLFYSYKGEHPATQEYVYQDFHNKNAKSTSHFFPPYDPETRPYGLCEMGGGMTCGYYYRFRLPYKSVDAMANVRLASGCNLLGYYMYHGGSNPLGINGLSMNESQVPKISYDYQAPLGEFGQVRESCRRTKLLHYFARTFARELCPLKTALPDGASLIDPKDVDTLRFAVRTDGHRGFLFINNFQDHVRTKDRQDEAVTLYTKGGTIKFSFGIAAEENAILPFNMELGGITLIQANAQPVTRLERDGETIYVFFVPRGMKGSFTFEGDAGTYQCQEDLTAEEFTVSSGGASARILVLSRELAEQMYMVSGNRLVFTDQGMLEDGDGLRLETVCAENRVRCYPAGALDGRAERLGGGVLGEYLYRTGEWKEADRELTPKETAPGRYTLDLPESLMNDVKDMRLQLDYSGDIGHVFLNSRLINDNFANGAVWEIGLREWAEELKGSQLVVYITPLKEGANVNVDSDMAARSEEVDGTIAELHSAALCPVYEIKL